MKNKFISNRVIKLNDGTIFFTSDKDRPTRDEIYFIDFWRENLSMYRINRNTRILRSKTGVGLCLISLPFPSYGLFCRKECPH